MKKAILLCACLMLGAEVHAARDIGTVTVDVDSRMLSVRVSASNPEMNALAKKAFQSHGRYNVSESSLVQYNIKFVCAGNQTRVEVSKGGAALPYFSQIVSGSSPRNALLRAADVAVEQTNGLGLKGFFASKLTFVSEKSGHKEVYIGDLFFGEVFQLTVDKAPVLSPRWSPDGGRIVYTSFFKSGFPDIFQVNTSTYVRTTFATFKGTNSGARFSPGGDRVAMVLSGPGNPEIFISDSQGHGTKRLTFTKDAVEASPCFSPDGSRLVYTSDAAGGPQLYVMPAVGGQPTRLKAGFNYCAEPDWSIAKPNLIAFTARAGGYQVAVYDMNTGKGEVVSKAHFDAIEPSWLADGRHIVYTARDKTSSVVCILDTVTGRSTKLSPVNLGQTFQASVHAP